MICLIIEKTKLKKEILVRKHEKFLNISPKITLVLLTIF